SDSMGGNAMRACLLIVVCALLLIAPGAEAKKKKKRKPGETRSSTIRVLPDDRTIVVVNRETDSLSVLQVRGPGGSDTQRSLAEIAVGHDPRCVAVDRKGKVAFVTNGASGTVSVVSLFGEDRFQVVGEIPVGNEPRGCAPTPNSTRLFVANFTDGT